MIHQSPIQLADLRRAGLLAAEHQILAERALMESWPSALLAPIPAGARWQGDEDPAPQFYPLGRWGNLIADLRQDSDALLGYMAASDADLWEQWDTHAADSQCLPNWHRKTGPEVWLVTREHDLRRQTSLGAVAQLIKTWRLMLNACDGSAPAELLVSVRDLITELLLFARAPQEPISTSALSDCTGVASLGDCAAPRGAAPFKPGSGVATMAPEPGPFSTACRQDSTMKPERIQLGMKDLSHWRQEGDSATFVCSLQFDDQQAAQDFLKTMLKMARNLSVDLDVNLRGLSLTLILPATREKLREGHLLLARGVESLAALSDQGTRSEETP